MKLPNGYGCIRKLTGKRRKPYHVSKKVGDVYDDKTMKIKSVYVTIGYCATKTEALQMLADYHKEPYSLERPDITFKEVYEEWYDSRADALSDSRKAAFRSVYKYYEPILGREFRTLKTRDFEEIIEGMPRTTKVLGKDLLSQLYKHALRYEYCAKDYSKMINVKTDLSPQSEKSVFTKEEIDRLWTLKDNTIVQMALFALYSGVRPAELFMITVNDVFIEDRYIVTGVKTENGKNRKVPIHKDVYNLVKEAYRSAVENSQTYLFENPFNHNKYTHMSFPHKFRAVCGENHTPYDTRHSFITYAKRSNINEYLLKRIVGHSIADLTERVYTHVEVSELIAEMDKVIVG